MRQALLARLVARGYSPARMQVERRFGSGADRVDLLVRDCALRPWMLVEVKAPQVNHRVGLVQLADYARALDVRYCVTLNGSWATGFALDRAAGRHRLLTSLPDYPAA